MARRRDRYEALAHRLKTGVAANAQAYRARILRDRDRVIALCGRAARCIDAQLDQRFARLEQCREAVDRFLLREVLKRGYALVRDEQGQPLRSAAAIANGMKLDIEMSDGNVKAVAGETVAAPPPRPVHSPPPLAPDQRRGAGQPVLTDLPGMI